MLPVSCCVWTWSPSMAICSSSLQPRVGMHFRCVLASIFSRCSDLFAHMPMICHSLPAPLFHRAPTKRVILHRLLYRSLQTMRIPVGDLIDILKVDVPEAPDVSLAGIRSDAATLEWSRPPPSRPVQKYVIQVNGVNGMRTPSLRPCENLS